MCLLDLLDYARLAITILMPTVWQISLSTFCRLLNEGHWSLNWRQITSFLICNCCMADWNCWSLRLRIYVGSDIVLVQAGCICIICAVCISAIWSSKCAGKQLCKCHWLISWLDIGVVCGVCSSCQFSTIYKQHSNMDCAFFSIVMLVSSNWIFIKAPSTGRCLLLTKEGNDSHLKLLPRPAPDHRRSSPYRPCPRLSCFSSSPGFCHTSIISFSFASPSALLYAPVLELNNIWTTHNHGGHAHWWAPLPLRHRITSPSIANKLPVLDGGTGFLKVGYAAQVCSILPITISHSDLVSYRTFQSISSPR